MKHCKKCGLGEDYTNIRFNDDGVCNYCEFYESHKDMLEDTEQLEQAFRRVFNTCKWNNMAETAELRLFLCQVYKNLMLYGVVFHVKQWYNGGYETLV